MRLRMRAKILGGRDDTSNGVIGELSWNNNRDDHAELVRSVTILHVRGVGEGTVRH
jgi:hypothetical protein